MKKQIITVSREFGSGGRELGKRLSDLLEIPYYDREILDELSARLNIDAGCLEKMSQRLQLAPANLHFRRSFHVYAQVSKGYIDVLVEQTKLLKEIAEKGSCVIIGRGANTILREYHPFNIFVYADTQSKLERCRAREAEGEHLSERELIRKMKEIDRTRAKTQELFSPHQWGEKSGYHLCVNTSGLEIKKLMPAIVPYTTKWHKERNL